MSPEQLALLASPQVQAFLANHAQEAIDQLVLRGGIPEAWPRELVADQLMARAKAKHKLPHWHNTLGIVFPPSANLEQASSEATARYKSSLVGGQHLLDLTLGTGVDAFFMAQGGGFTRIDAVEPSATLCALAMHNMQHLGLEGFMAHHNTAEELLKATASSSNYDWIYLDPSRREANNTRQGNRVVGFAESLPNVVALLPQLMATGQKIMVKASPMLDIAEGLRQLGGAQQVHVVGHKGECKEVLFILGRKNSMAPDMVALEVDAQGRGNPFTYNLAQEAEAAPEISPPSQYLYEPSPVLMKAGAYGLLALRYGLQKLHPHSHLYTSPNLLNEFPGRRFELMAQAKVQKKALARHVPGGKAHMVIRNFPGTVAQLRPKLGLKEGGEQYVFLTTLANGEKAALVCQRY